jgi:uncharacterized cupredoxin-like copper-binding protein
MRSTRPAGSVVLLAFALAAAGCGSSSGNDSSTSALTLDLPATKASTTAPAANGDTAALDATTGAVKITAKDLSFSTNRIDARAGKLEVTLDNKAQAPHEFVVIRTVNAPDKLPIEGAAADERGSIGEIGKTAGGKSKSGDFDLKPGHYVFICNMPGHYAAGMSGEIDVR